MTPFPIPLTTPPETTMNFVMVARIERVFVAENDDEQVKNDER